MATSDLTALLQAAQQLYDTVQYVRGHRERCRRLEARVKTIVAVTVVALQSARDHVDVGKDRDGRGLNNHEGEDDGDGATRKDEADSGANGAAKEERASNGTSLATVGRSMSDENGRSAKVESGKGEENHEPKLKRVGSGTRGRDDDGVNGGQRAGGGVRQLVATLQTCTTFMDSLRSDEWTKQTQLVDDDATTRRFEELNAELSRAAQALQVGLAIHRVFGRDDDQRDRANDLAQLRKLLAKAGDEAVRSKLQGLAAQLELLLRAPRRDDSGRVWSVPPAPSRFVGREAEVARLSSVLRPSPADTSATWVVITGASGSGKSSLASRVANQVHERFSNGWMLDGSSELALFAGLDRVARDLDLAEVAADQVARAVRARLSLPDRVGWLVVVHNADDPSFARTLPNLLPNLGGCLLLTSRLPHWDTDAGWTVIPLAPMTAPEATDLLVQHVPDQAAPSKMLVGRILAKAGALPLALASAAAYVQRTKLPWMSYPAKVEEQMEVNSRANLVQTDIYRNVLPALHVYLLAAVEMLPPAASMVLQLLQPLDANGVPVPLLSAAYIRIYGAASSSASVPSLDEVLGTLSDYGIVAVSGGSVRIHRLMQLVVCAAMPYDKDALTALSSVMSALVFERYNSGDYPLLRHLLLQYNALLAWMKRTCPEAAERVVSLLACSLIHEFGLRQRREADALFELALSTREAYFTAEHAEVAAELAKVANEFGVAGELDKQKTLLERVLAMQERHYGPSHREVAVVLTSLGGTFAALGEPAKQLPLLERALAINQVHCGVGHPEVAVVLTSLANAHGSLGDAAKKKKLLEQALAINERHGGKDSIEVATTLNNLGNACGDLGDVPKQKALLERALAIKERHYGAQHVELVTTLNNLGNAYGALGRASKQRDLLERALAIQESHYGPSHPKLVGTLNNLASAHASLGDPGKQRSLLERALRISEQHFGKTSGQLTVTLLNLGVACRALGDHYAARGHLERCAAVAKGAYGADHALTRRAQAAFSKLPVDNDHAAVAAAALARSVSSFSIERTGGPPLPRTTSQQALLSALELPEDTTTPVLDASNTGTDTVASADLSKVFEREPPAETDTDRCCEIM